MKFVKGISLFFVCPLLLIGIGFCSGVWAIKFFYPGTVGDHATKNQIEYMTEESTLQRQSQNPKGNVAIQETPAISGTSEKKDLQEVAALEETLNADTKYVVQERDLLRDTVVETVWQIPGKYIGMNRELFLSSMEEYQENPPLSEKERGFTGLEVLSFAPERVVVQMNYKYVQPSESFYLVVQDNEVVVLLEDMKTVFINTGIRLEDLPELLQMKIIQMYFIEDEESLYNFLETYSS